MAKIVSMVVKIHGRVQGVYFRTFVKEQAERLGIVGYAKNIDRGKMVEVKAEATMERLEALIEHLRAGPPTARVEKMEVEWGEFSGNYSSFDIM